jgi:Mg2+/Co2+ transporter CorB
LDLDHFDGHAVDTIPFWVNLLALLCLLFVSAFFSISETSMVALNRHRLSHLVRAGRRGAERTAALLARTDRLLSTILIGNNVVNTALTAFVTALAIRYYGDSERVILGASIGIAFLLIVFCEITPKVVGATYPDRIALPSSFVLGPLMRVLTPALWFVNLLTGSLLRVMGIDTRRSDQSRLSPEELRSIVIESAPFMPAKHRSILLNLFDLERITVDDVMTPRGRVEALDIATSPDQIREQLATCYHNKLPVYEVELNRVIGILHVRRALALLAREEFGAEDIRELLAPPYFIPSGTPVFTQLQFFQENRRRLGLVVDEYGEVQGLVTLEDIMEEIIGEFTTGAPGPESAELVWDARGEAVVEGATPLRELNRRLGTRFPLDGPRTVSGWILESLQDIPEANASVRFGDLAIEITHLQDRTVRSVRLRRLREPAPVHLP